MKFKKIGSTVLIVVSLLYLFSLSAFGEELDPHSESADYGAEIYSALDGEAKEILSSFGIDTLNFDSVFNISFSQSFRAVGDILKSSVKDAAPYFFKMLAMLIAMTVIAAVRPDKSGEKDIVSSVFAMITVIMTASFVSDILTQTVGVFNLTGKLLLTLAPIITALLSVSGNVTVSVLYNSVTVAAAQIVSSIAAELLIPLIGVYFSFVISLDLGEDVKGDRLVHSINKVLTGGFAALSTVFTFILSVKNVLAKDLDGVLYKSGKYVISSFVPVVGSNISAILSSVVGSLELIKSTVAVFGIICVAAINIPILVKLSVCYAVLCLLGIIGDLFSAPSASSVVRGFAGGIKLLTAMVFFELVLVIIATGLTVTIKGAAG